jgi:molybdopterin adenylyltransferase
VSVITISDRAFRGEYPDLSGPEIQSLIRERFPEAEVSREIVEDERECIVSAFERHSAADYILTTGGTGISPRDLTPETTRDYCERDLPGVAEALRAESLKETPFAMLSRGYAGIKGDTIIINFPGSVKAARLCTSVLLPVMEHGIEMIQGLDHGSDRGSHGSHGSGHARRGG